MIPANRPYLQSDPISNLAQAGGRKLMLLALVVVFGIVGLYCAANMVEHVDQGQIMAIQYPSGNLGWFENGGYHMQWFGRVVKFPKRSQLWFTIEKDDKGNIVSDTSFKVRFNDGGHGFISGSMAYEMPSDIQHLTALYQKYQTPDAIAKDLVGTVVGKSIYMTGPLMSSKESYAERRNDLVSLIEDQAANGIYQTDTQDKDVTDPLTGDKRTVTVVHIKVGQDGNYLRQEASPLKEFGIRTYNFSIKSLDYDDKVEKQIQTQQDAVMQVQTAIAQAKQAEQAAITAAKNGEAEAAKAKWEQEVIKAKAVTEGQQKLEVAQLDAKAAEQFKIAETLRGEGEGARRRAVMQADGALEKKLEAWIQVNGFYAEAIKDHPGNWVPTIQMGSGGLGGGGNAADLIQLFTAKTAKDLSLSLALPGETQK
jgi:regulator of protease activity HflC (stomatin/prohibitin superfamily)